MVDPQRKRPTAAMEDEAKRATKLLKGKTVKKVWRHRPEELAIEFDDGTRLFVDREETGLELSITGGACDAE